MAVYSLIVSLLAVIESSQCGWVELKSCDLVEGLSSHTMVGYKDALYVFGGIFPNGTESGLFMKYNTTTDDWSLIESEHGPSARRFHSAAVDKVGHALYVIGGDREGDFKRDYWKFDLVNGTWALVMVGKEIYTGHGAYVHYGEVIMFGGYTGFIQSGSSFGKMARDSSAVEAVEWTEVGFSGKQHSVECTNKMVVSSGRVYVLPSLDVGIYEYNLIRGTWNSLTAHKKAANLVGHTLNEDGDRIMVFGGFRDHDLQNDLMIYHIEIGEWEEMAKGGGEPDKRFLHSSWVLDHDLYVFGGQLELGKYSNQLFKYRISF